MTYKEAADMWLNRVPGMVKLKGDEFGTCCLIKDGETFKICDGTFDIITLFEDDSFILNAFGFTAPSDTFYKTINAYLPYGKLIYRNRRWIYKKEDLTCDFYDGLHILFPVREKVTFWNHVKVDV